MAGEGALKVISSMATTRALRAIAAALEARGEARVEVESVGGIVAAQRVAAGEALDIVVLSAEAIDALAAGAHVDGAGRVTFCESAVTLAVAPGLPVPRIDSADAVREALLAAPRIAYSTGPSGRHLIALIEHWGLTHALAARLVQSPPGVGVGALLLRGDAEIGVQQMSELIHVEGIGIAGELPHAIQQLTAFCGAVCTKSARPADARRMLAAFAAPAFAATWRENGLEPWVA